MNDKVPCSSTKLIRGGTAYSSSPFELNLQLHGQVSNPYSFGIKQNYKSSATTKASIPPYTEKSWTTPGTYTWTVPVEVTRIRVAVCGGGGGSCGQGMGSTTLTGGTGGSSSFGNLVTATGGKGGYLRIKGSTIEGSSHGTGGSPNGDTYTGDSLLDIKGTPSSFGGHELSFNDNSGPYGQAVRVKQSGTNYINFTYGGGGGFNSQYVDLSKSTYDITVGKGGDAKNYNLLANTTITNMPSSEGNGFVLIAYGEGIE